MPSHKSTSTNQNVRPRLCSRCLKFRSHLCFEPYLLHPATAFLPHINTQKKTFVKSHHVVRFANRLADAHHRDFLQVRFTLFLCSLLTRARSLSLYSLLLSLKYIIYKARDLRPILKWKRWGYGPPNTSHPRIKLRFVYSQLHNALLLYHVSSSFSPRSS